MKEQNVYSSDWFAAQKKGAFNSAEVVVPIVLDLISPKSVVDAGCGVGIWLKSFMDHGVMSVCGIDGDYIKMDQPGTNHINGQWPEYWAKLFKQFGYIPVDAIRRKVWTNPKVEYWYAQNMIVYIKENELSHYPRLAQEVENGFSSALPLVHPERYRYALKPPATIPFRIKRRILSWFGRRV